MPTKSTKTTAKKADDEKPAKAAPAPARTSAPKASPLKPITGRPAAGAEKTARGAKDAKAGKDAKATKETKEEKPAKPAQPAEVVSLIDEKPKALRRKPDADPVNKPFAKLPSISRLKDPEPVKPVPVVEPVAPPSAEGDPADEKAVHLKPPIIVRDLAAAMGIKPYIIIGDLMGMNILVSLTQAVEPDIATKICEKHGFTFAKEKRNKGEGVHKPAPAAVEPPKQAEKPKADQLKLRPPVVTFMGHVDHGKTTLMDAIRKTRVAAGEAGGITQHIGAYSVTSGGHKITFLDTPGHAAFTAMRARGATVTDIVVLVVAADDGFMPQTIEAMNHAKAAKVQIIAAITKTDLPGANIDRVKGQLQEKGLQPEDWGGETIACPVSAVKGQGVDKLLESILLIAEVAELQATEQGAARATVIEAQVEQGRGPTATLIVRSGTLSVGDPFICGDFDGKVKALIDDFGKPLKTAGPSTPCKVLGFSGMPNAGDELIVMESDRAAKALAIERQGDKRMQKLTSPQRATLETLFQNIADGHKPTLRLVLKCDVQGSIEAITTSLRQIDSKKVDLDIVHSGVGPISENDVLLATASNAIIVGFGVKTENVAAAASKREGVEIKLYSIIYELIDQIKDAMAGLLAPESRESVIGHAEIRKVFDLTKGIVAGCYVTDGRILRVARARIVRGRTPIYDGPITTLRRFQDDVKEVKTGFECGIKLGDFTEYTEGDVVQCYNLEKVPQKL